MRTTLTIDDDILQAAKSLAATRSVPVGQVISELARKGLESPAKAGRRRSRRNGLPTFSVGRGARPITLEDVRKLEDES
jgi:hypothetical protein